MTTNPLLQCPITLATMREPVIATDGITYEKDAIIAWLRQHGTSPQTRQPMNANDLLPNRAIAQVLESGTVIPLTMPSFEKKDVRFSHFSHAKLAEVSESTSATLHIQSNSIGNTLSARVHIQTPNPSVSEVDSLLTTPNHVCCVIDVSGSMNMEAVSKDEDGNVLEDSGLTILDIVKFSTLVIAESLNDHDKFSIVTFSDDAKTVLPPMHMTMDGKAVVKYTLETIRTECQTNIFDGLKLGIEQAHMVGNEYINSVLVLTDGYPNIHPAAGYENAMAQVLSNTPIFGALSTFGFGYHLDSKLLADIAKIGGGYYSFIPDAGMVGTCFINALANSRSTFGVHPMLKISGCDFNLFAKQGIIPVTVARRNTAKAHLSTGSSKAKKITGEVVAGLTLDRCLETTILEGDIYIKLTPLRYGCDIDVMLRPLLFQENRDTKIELVFDTIGGNTKNFHIPPAEGNVADELFHSKRAQFVEGAYSQSFNLYDDSVVNIFLDATEEKSTGHAALDALYQDMRGQATEAIATEHNFKTWGKHFLLSLSTAHLHQFCNNFKDPGVQVYGTGLLFSSLQDTLDDIFEKVPPAVPSRHYNESSAPVDMSKVYNNRNAACVHGKTLVTVKNPSLQKADKCNVINVSLTTSSSFNKISNIPICEIQKGDLVLTANGTYAKVDCLVETVVDNKALQPPFELIQIGQLCVTPYHPLKLNQHSGWQFPIQIPDSKWMVPNDDQYTPAYSVFNLVLESGQRHKAVLMDGIESITLGHGITNDCTLKHSYFGTDEIISDLEVIQAGSGGKAGHIILRESYIKRDTVSGCINSISGTNVAVEEEVTIVNNMYSCAPCAPCAA